MEAKEAVKELKSKAPRVLADGDVYAVQINQQYFGSFDEDGYAWVHNTPTHLSHEQAVEIAGKIPHAKVVRIPPENNGKINFWVSEDYLDEPYSSLYSERTLQVGRPVRSRYEGIPGWFKAAMMKFSPEGSFVTTWDDEEYDDGLIALEIFSEEAGHGLHWLDHEGWSGEDEKSVFVSEPYHLEQEDIQQLIEACDKFGFKFTISGESEHYPSSTVRIEISPIEKLSYVRPVRVMSPEQKAWEDQRTVVFYSLIRRMAADYIEHVLHVVEPSWLFGEVRALDFIKCSLNVARCYAAGYDNELLLTEYHESAGKKYREAVRAKFDGPTTMVLHAVQYLLAPNGRHLCSIVKNICADAIQRWMEDQDSADDMKPYNDELAWQEAHSKQAWDEYERDWHDYQEAA